MGLDVYDTRNLSQWLAANNDNCLKPYKQVDWQEEESQVENSWL
jgi:hypothetical protein